MTGEIPDDQSVDPPNTKHHSHNNDTKQISLDDTKLLEEDQSFPVCISAS